MKTYIVRTRIENNETTGTRPIYLPAGFGTVKGALFYYTTSNATLNVLDSTTNDQTFGIGFAGPPLGGAGVTSRTAGIIIDTNGSAGTTRTYSYNWSDRCAYSGLPDGSVSRQLRVTGFAQNRIDCDLTVTGVQTVPLDITITVFSGTGLSVAVNSLSTSSTGIGLTTSAFWITGMTFRPDLILGAYTQNSVMTGVSSVTDAQISFGASLRSPGAGSTSAQETCISYRNQNTVGSIAVTSTVSDSAIVRGIRNANEIRVSNWGGTGFSIFNFGAAAGGSYPVHFMAFYEYNTEQYDVEPILYRSSIGSSFHTVGYIPQLIIGAVANTDSAFDTIDITNESDSINIFTGYGLGRKNNTGLGTITSSTGSTTVTGTGTSFRGTIAKGDIIYNSSLTSLGTVAFVVSNTTLQLTANAGATVSAGSWMYEQNPQYSLSIITERGQTPAAGANSTIVSRDMIRSYNGDAGNNTAIVSTSGNLINFDSRPGFGISYHTATYGAIFRKGFYVAFDDTDKRARRGTSNSQ
jgi:hypothetical protein